MCQRGLRFLVTITVVITVVIIFYSPISGEDFNIIQQEIAILSECKHPNIVGYHGSYLR